MTPPPAASDMATTAASMVAATPDIPAEVFKVVPNGFVFHQWATAMPLGHLGMASGPVG